MRAESANVGLGVNIAGGVWIDLDRNIARSRATVASDIVREGIGTGGTRCNAHRGTVRGAIDCPDPEIVQLWVTTPPAGRTVEV